MQKCFKVADAQRRNRCADVIKCIPQLRVMGAMPRRHIPETPDAFTDSKEASPSLFAAASYIEWLNRKTKIHSEHVPSLTHAINQAIEKLPREVQELIVRKIFTNSRALCTIAV